MSQFQLKPFKRKCFQKLQFVHIHKINDKNGIYSLVVVVVVLNIIMVNRVGQNSSCWFHFQKNR
ncbi:hypothetical protein BpHYR1_046696 [Brachionus plicatilis]|uniref:Transmembrane protein n=1 Tax=Brachionus plicatilis TaxID=10195 RepID=A0A3M7RVG4_BRAPC|nr:hypothetical protein BpHYR1_046696 [Brachionus plicatilis]